MSNVTPSNTTTPQANQQAAELAALKKQLADAQAALAKAGAAATSQAPAATATTDFPKNADGSYKTYRLPSTPCSYIFSNAKQVIAPEGLITPENDMQASELYLAFLAGNIWDASAEKVSDFQKDVLPVSAAAVEQGVNTNTTQK